MGKKKKSNSRDPPTAMLDQHGKLQTDEDTIKEMTKEAYTKRLENRPTKQGMRYMEFLKESLCMKQIKEAQ